MDSVMVPFEYEVEVFPSAGTSIASYQLRSSMPEVVASWIESEVWREFILTEQEEREMEHYTVRTLGFEVEVRYVEKDGVRKAVDATLQTLGVPMYVTAYLENQAMQQVNEQKEVAK